MIQNNNKTSLLIPSQLPEFIRDDPSYKNFTLFLQAYYEWMEQQNNVTDRSKNLLNYMDIDNTTDAFLDYFYNDFLPYFPKEILADKQKVTKIAKELYKTKGTPASYKFLFRVLYDTDVDFFYTKDAVLRASAGKWYIAKSLKLASNDINFLNISNLRIFGETTKSIAVIENSVLSGIKTEVFISNIERLFQSGEYVHVVDSNNQDAYFLNGNQVFADTNGNYPVGAKTLRAKIVGQISQIKIDPKNRGKNYKAGDPVVVYGGLNSTNGHGASGIIGETTTGAITGITVNNGGYGYAPITSSAQTVIIIINGGGATAEPSPGGSGFITTSANSTANVAFIPINSISKQKNITIGSTNYNFSNIAISNVNTTLSNAFTFVSFSTYPLSAVRVGLAGTNLSVAPTVSAASLYQTEYNDTLADIKKLGILAPIQIINGGSGYVANDTITFTGGSGYGAYANVLTVNATGSITSIGYVYKKGENPVKYPIGGMGYNNGLPSVAVANNLASGASIYVPGILGDGATFTAVTDRIGEITSINVTDPGEDYVGAPNVSLLVQDIFVSNVSPSIMVQSGDIVYQGNSYGTSSYIAVVDSITQVYSFPDPTQTLWKLRVYNYNAFPNYNLPIKANTKNSVMVMSNQYPTLFPTDTNVINNKFDATKSFIVYGDGLAKANASFLNGLVIGQGQYLDTSGQPSSFDVLQSVDYNNYTYQITLEKEIEKYRKTLLNLLHPTGMKVLGRFAMKSNNAMNFSATDILNTGHTLSFYTGTNGSNVTMTASFTNPSNNIIQFNNLAGANLANIVFSNSIISFVTANNDTVYSEVNTINFVANTVTLTSNVWMAFANVANITANSGSNVINIKSLTNSYNIVNNGVYSNTLYPLKDIVRAGDTVLIANNSQANVLSVDYINNKITLTSNLTNNSNSYLSVSRTLSAYGNKVIIYGPVGTQYYPQIITESGDLITTEDGAFILLG